MIGTALSAVAAVAERRRDPEMARRQFDGEVSAQICALRRQNCPKAILKTLEKKRPQVIARAVGMTFLGSKRVFFSSVIPASQLSIPEQMLMVRNGDIPGCTYLDTTRIADLVEMPRESYYIFSVEDGTRTLGWTPYFGEKVFKTQPNRRGLSVVESIGLCRNTDTLKHHNIDAIWSRLKRTKIPFLWVLVREPRLCADNANTSDPRWGIPSCNTVVI